MTGRLWNHPNAPRHGWVCIGVYDVYEHGDVLEKCQACGEKKIRYVHIMQHPDYSQTVDAGCHCASKMEMDSNAADIRESDFINKQKRRNNWLKDNWKINEKGNYIKRKEGYIITLFHRNKKWGYSISKRAQKTSNTPIFSQRYYDNVSEAKKASFEEFEDIK